MFTQWRWYEVKDGDPALVELYRRHYSSAKKSARTYHRYGFSGNGESLALRTSMGDAGFMWTRQKIRDDKQVGVNCSFFRNEGMELSSSLILEAEQLALNKWPDAQRFFTYIDAGKVRRKRDPGRCFVKAGWRKCGKGKDGKLIFEKLVHP